jgi:hypothetical protein
VACNVQFVTAILFFTSWCCVVVTAIVVDVVACGTQGPATLFVYCSLLTYSALTCLAAGVVLILIIKAGARLQFRLPVICLAIERLIVLEIDL